MTSLESRVRAVNSATPREEQRTLWYDVRRGLESGEVRAATCENGVWQVQTWVKEAILMAFRTGDLVSYGQDADSAFGDKDTLPPRIFDISEGVRIVPGGSSVRSGAYVARGVTVMPPAFINVGAYIETGTMVDSHALVGSCAQIGKRVHLSAAAQIGGVLEPVSARPVIIEDDVFVGGNCGVFEGVLVRRGAVLATGVILNASTVVYDLVNERVLRGDANTPLEIPAGAVVVPGGRRLAGNFAESHGLIIQTPLILKYRDDRTDTKTQLEEALRGYTP